MQNYRYDGKRKFNIRTFDCAGKASLKEELDGCGKEGRKLYEHFKKASKEQIALFIDRTNLSYRRFEDELKQYMEDYEFAAGADGTVAESALAVYADKVQAAFEAHRDDAEAFKEETAMKLSKIAVEYVGLGEAFHPADADEACDCCEEACEGDCGEPCPCEEACGGDCGEPCPCEEACEDDCGCLKEEDIEEPRA